MDNEPTGGQNSIEVCSVADVEQHIRDASGGPLLKSRQRLPDPVDTLFNPLLLQTDVFSQFIRIFFSCQRLFDHGLAGGMQTHVPELVNHVALRVPMLVLAVTENLNELFQNGGLAPVTALSEFCGIMEMAVYAAVVLIIAVLRPKHGRTNGACEVLDVVFTVEGGYVRTTQRATA